MQVSSLYRICLDKQIFLFYKYKTCIVAYLHSIAFSTDLKVFGRLLKKFCILFKASIAVPTQDDQGGYTMKGVHISNEMQYYVLTNIFQVTKSFSIGNEGGNKRKKKIYLPLHQSHTGLAMMARDWLRQCGLLLLRPCCDQSSLPGVGFHHKGLPQLSQHPCMMTQLVY